MNIVQKVNSILKKEGVIGYIKRKLNITYLDNKTLFTINYRDKKIKIYLNRKNGFVDMMIFKNGIYEKEIIDDIVNALDSEKVFLDIGSNIGQHSLIVSHFCKQVYAFEPIPDIYLQFQKNIKRNKFKNIKVYNTAIGEKKEELQFNYVEGHAGASSIIKLKKRNNIKIINIKVDTLKNILKEKTFDVVKIDVEGYEAVVVFGNKDILLSNRPKIFMEFTPDLILEEGSQNPEALFHLFLENNYTIFSRKLNRELTIQDTDNLHHDNWILTPKK